MKQKTKNTTTSYAMDPETKWITDHFSELVDRYGGKYVAVAREKVAAVSDNPTEAEKKTLEQYPDSRPSVLLVPTKHDLICVL